MPASNSPPTTYAPLCPVSPAPQSVTEWMKVKIEVVRQYIYIFYTTILLFLRHAVLNWMRPGSGLTISLAFIRSRVWKLHHFLFFVVYTCLYCCSCHCWICSWLCSLQLGIKKWIPVSTCSPSLITERCERDTGLEMVVEIYATGAKELYN